MQCISLKTALTSQMPFNTLYSSNKEAAFTESPVNRDKDVAEGGGHALLMWIPRVCMGKISAHFHNVQLVFLN